MHESATHEAILRMGREEGRIMGSQRYLIRQGTKKFGKADGATPVTIESIRDFEKLEALAERILDPGVRDWSELLQTS
jgi:hypothetical protein